MSTVTITITDAQGKSSPQLVTAAVSSSSSSAQDNGLPASTITRINFSYASQASQLSPFQSLVAVVALVLLLFCY
jgi:ABC-type phosphate transport system permease subunit